MIDVSRDRQHVPEVIDSKINRSEKQLTEKPQVIRVMQLLKTKKELRVRMLFVSVFKASPDPDISLTIGLCDIGSVQFSLFSFHSK